MLINSSRRRVSLPDDLLVEILLRLPVRSLLRFKCVCKLWRSLICDPQFAQSHFDLGATHILYGHNAFDDSINSIDLSDCSVISLHLPPPPPVAYRAIIFWGSCRGFVLLRHWSMSEFIIWNPSTGMHIKVPFTSAMMMRENSSLYVCGFGYDVSTDDYLIIVVKQIDSMLFSVKTNSWNYLHDPYEGKEMYKEKLFNLKAGLLSNRALHWFVCCLGKQVGVIVAFDLVRRSLLEIPLPAGSARAWHFELQTIGGCLGVMCNLSGLIEVWVMKEYKVLSSWTRLFVSVISSPLNICKSRYGGLIESTFCCQNGNRGKIIGRRSYYPKSEEMEDKIKRHGLCEPLAYGEGIVLYDLGKEDAVYKESLLSMSIGYDETSQDHQP